MKYQVKACRPSGRKGDKITNVPMAKNYEWDKLIWIMYDKEYRIVVKAWLWERDNYISKFDKKKRLSPRDMRDGENLLSLPK